MEQIAAENSNADPSRHDGVMITGVEIKYRAETLPFPEADLTDADPPQNRQRLSVAASTNHKGCGDGGGGRHSK